MSPITFFERRMKITTRFVLLFAMSLGLLVLPACSDSTTEPTPDAVDTTTFAYQDVRPDSVTGWLYYSLDSMKIVSPGSASWDIRLPYIFCCGRSRSIPVQLNSGSNGPGTTAGAMVSGRYETITAMPAGVTLRTDDTLAPVVPTAVAGPTAVFVYDAPSRTLRPSPDKTLIVRSGSGKLFKFGIVSIYQNANSNPTLDTPIGFYHFRVARLNQ